LGEYIEKTRGNASVAYRVVGKRKTGENQQAGGSVLKGRDGSIPESAKAPSRWKSFPPGGQSDVRIPREFELPGNEAILRREGNRLIIDPVIHRSLLALLATWNSFEEDFPEIRDLPPEPVDL
jgi:antitoxin VapB